MIETFHATLGPRGECWEKEVVYSDVDDRPSIDGVAMTSDPERYKREYPGLHFAEAYFRKRVDWASECECRLLFLPPEPIEQDVYLPIGGALKCITVGSYFAPTGESLLSAVCLQRGVALTQLQTSGIVSLRPFASIALDSLSAPFLRSDV